VQTLRSEEKKKKRNIYLYSSPGKREEGKKKGRAGSGKSLAGWRKGRGGGGG